MSHLDQGYPGSFGYTWVSRTNEKRGYAKMMDHERQEKELQEVFEATQRAYRSLMENTLALQERTLELAFGMLETSGGATQRQAESNRSTLAREPGRAVRQAVGSDGEVDPGGERRLCGGAQDPLLSPPSAPHRRGRIAASEI